MQNEFTELQEKWLQALESGEYEQTTDNLVADGGFCCLGVATTVVNPDHEALGQNGWSFKEWSEEHDIELDSLKFRYGDDDMTAPPDVVDELQLSNSSGDFMYGRVNDTKSLIGLNDNEDYTFEEIAAFIREKPWTVFKNFDKPGEVK